MQKLSVEQVRAQVQNFWRIFTSKSAAEFESLYFPEGTILEMDARRIEPARLMVARRIRELLAERASVNAEVGTMDVQILEPNVAVVAYSLHFHVIRLMPSGKRRESDVRVARATQVFQRDEHGALRILHEHLSAGAVSLPVELPD